MTASLFKPIYNVMTYFIDMTCTYLTYAKLRYFSERGALEIGIILAVTKQQLRLPETVLALHGAGDMYM